MSDVPVPVYITRELATIDPPQCLGGCYFCEAGSVDPNDHHEECLWRLARVWTIMTGGTS